MGVIIPDEILQATRMTAEELRQEIAILLFQKDKLTLGQASRLAGMSRLQFQHLPASRQIPVHYDIAEFEEDLKYPGGWTDCDCCQQRLTRHEPGHCRNSGDTLLNSNSHSSWPLPMGRNALCPGTLMGSSPAGNATGEPDSFAR
jgi:predicted HTH domain antitoxin